VTLLIRPAAAADIEDAYRWYARQRPELGSDFVAAVRRGIGRILENPEGYQVVHRDARRIRLKRFPYGLIYRVYSDKIIVVACMHGKRDPRRWKARV